MFCRSCRKEISHGARHCIHCGVNQETGSRATTSTPRRRRRSLPLLHTFHWWATCPKCGEEFTAETFRCPNDDAPFVIAFDCGRGTFTQMPMESAHLRCSNNCGVSYSGFSCSHCNTFISDSSVVFRIPILNNLIYQTTCLAALLVLVWAATFMARTAYRTSWAGKEFISLIDVWIFGMPILFWSALVWKLMRMWMWKLRFHLDLGECRIPGDVQKIMNSSR